MLNHFNLFKHQLLATIVVKIDILLHNAKLKEKIKENKEEIKAIIETTTKDIIQIITKEKEPQDLITDLKIINGNKETDHEIMKESQTIIEIRVEIKEAEVDHETYTRLIEKVNTNKPLHYTQEMSTT